MSGLPAPPSNLLPFFQEAASGTGLPISVVEAQNFEESGYGTNMGPSSAGAEGPWQFLPRTYAGTGQPAGTEFQWGPSTKAYITYMSQLLKQEGGSVFKALEAYNAGPNNLGAGAGYASNILSLAGQPQSATASGGTGTTGTTGGSLPCGLFSPQNCVINALTGWTTDFWKVPLQIVEAAFGGFGLKEIIERAGLIVMGAIIIIIGLFVLARPSNIAEGAGMIAAPEAASAISAEHEQGRIANRQKESF